VAVLADCVQVYVVPAGSAWPFVAPVCVSKNVSSSGVTSIGVGWNGREPPAEVGVGLVEGVGSPHGHESVGDGDVVAAPALSVGLGAMVRRSVGLVLGELSSSRGVSGTIGIGEVPGPR
jgi:hypothetical protein